MIFELLLVATASVAVTGDHSHHRYEDRIFRVTRACKELLEPEHEVMNPVKESIRECLVEHGFEELAEHEAVKHIEDSESGEAHHGHHEDSHHGHHEDSHHGHHGESHESGGHHNGTQHHMHHDNGHHDESNHQEMHGNGVGGGDSGQMGHHHDNHDSSDHESHGEHGHHGSHGEHGHQGSHGEHGHHGSHGEHGHHGSHGEHCHHESEEDEHESHHDGGHGLGPHDHHEMHFMEIFKNMSEEVQRNISECVFEDHGVMVHEDGESSLNIEMVQEHIRQMVENATMSMEDDMEDAASNDTIAAGIYLLDGFDNCSLNPEINLLSMADYKRCLVASCMVGVIKDEIEDLASA